MRSTAEPLSGTVDEASIARPIDRVRTAVRRDPVLGRVFETAIAVDDQALRVATMRAFRSSVMRTSRRYSGDPVAVHRAVQGLERPMSERWPTPSETTAAGLFVPGQAEGFAPKPRRIASSLQLALPHRLDEPPDGPPARATPGHTNAA
jgi:hemoglobin